MFYRITLRSTYLAVNFFKPLVCDIPMMQNLVESEVQSGTILHRTEDEMATTIRSYTAVSVDGQLAGFCALHIHSIALAEIRSLIVGDQYRGKNLGKKLVESSLEEAKSIGIKRVLSLTYQEDFFKRLGFDVIEKESIPEHKIWADCVRCKHFPICDEIALMYTIQ